MKIKTTHLENDESFFCVKYYQKVGKYLKAIGTSKSKVGEVLI